jgi:hypothetical protein
MPGRAGGNRRGILHGQAVARDAQAFEDHCLACPLCARIAIETDRFIRAMKGAAVTFKRKKMAASNGSLSSTERATT